MSTGEAMDDASDECVAARLSGAREALALAMLVYGLAQSGEAFAADLSAGVVKDLQPMAGGKPVPKAFAAAAPSSEFEAAPTEFRRRKPDDLALLSSTPLEGSFQSRPQQATSPWQHLADYRAQGRLQLLTLWQSPRSMLSLQTGRHGGPSLQWSSRVMNHGGATRGLLDRFVASSLGAAGLRSKSIVHGAESVPASKVSSLLPGNPP